MIRITGNIFIDEKDIQKRFIRASGPGGQHVNKASTAVQIRYDARQASTLPEDVKKRAIVFAGKQATVNGVIVIEAKRFRSQEQNLQDAMNRLTRIIRSASEKPKARRKTLPTKGSITRRLDTKRRRSRLKRFRSRVGRGEE